jgi:hypothetical protein
MDVQDLSARASARCGIRIEPHDPAFVLITLNQLVLEDTVATICAQVATRIASFAESIQNVERLAGKTLAREIRASGIEVRRGIQDDVKQAGWQARALVLQISRLSSRPVLIRWAAIGLVGAVLMFVFGVCFGWNVPLR